MVRGRVHELRYLVEIPIPYVDRRGRALDRRKRLRWQRRIGEVLTECFGGFNSGEGAGDEPRARSWRGMDGSYREGTGRAPVGVR